MFGIGLCETGVPALAEALGSIGFKVRTDPPADAMLSGQFPGVIEGFDGIAGPTAGVMFRELDLAFPDSKFVLTLRPSHDWLEALQRRIIAGTMHQSAEAIYGLSSFHRDALLATYELHKAAVLAHFVGREDDLLLLDLYRGEGWERLCPFLGERSPRRLFPRLDHAADHPAVLAA